jgi:hypothetical protein
MKVLLQAGAILTLASITINIPLGTLFFNYGSDPHEDKDAVHARLAGLSWMMCVLAMMQLVALIILVYAATGIGIALMKCEEQRLQAQRQLVSYQQTMRRSDEPSLLDLDI